MAIRTAVSRRVRPSVGALFGLVVLVVGLVPGAPAVAATVPAGWQLASSETVGAGVEHQTLRMANPTQEVHVARLAPGGTGRLLPVLAHDVMTGLSAGPEATSAMCARTACVAAVNGDFFDAAGQPVGAMVSGGELLTTPGIDHILFRIDAQGRPTLRPGLDWSVGVTTAGGQALAVQAVNRALAGEGITLYSRRWGPSTATDPATTEVTLTLPAPSGAALPTGTSAVGVSPPRAGGNLPIGVGQVVLAAHGAGARALADLAARASSAGGAAVLRVDAGGIASAIGGSPQLLQRGALAYPTENQDDFTQGRHPRTMVGVTPSGEILLVTADGPGPGSSAAAGLTLLEAARLMSGLGAVDAMNLDGGGSTTFVGTGTVRNHPSTGAERPVASALVVTASPLDPVAVLLGQVNGTLTGLLPPPPLPPPPPPP